MSLLKNLMEGSNMKDEKALKKLILETIKEYSEITETERLKKEIAELKSSQNKTDTETKTETDTETKTETKKETKKETEPNELELLRDEVSKLKNDISANQDANLDEGTDIDQEYRANYLI